jgi:hypothetical protein
MSDNIFINYRRQTDAGVAGRIYDALTRALPGATLFMDVDKLTPGEDFEQGLEKSLDSCKVMLAIVGPQWATHKEPDGTRRLDNPHDFVRREISKSLGKGVRVIPVLIGGAQLPTSAELPDDLKPFAKRQAMEIRHERFSADVEALAQAIANVTPGARGQSKRWLAAGGIAALVLAGGFAAFKATAPSSRGPQPASATTKADPQWTEWLDQEGYQREFDRQVRNGWYPHLIEAQPPQRQGDPVKYRANYKPAESSTFRFHARHSINDAEFAAFDAEMSKSGYTRVFQQRIVLGPRAYNQGTWTKN